jgi:hypothetical protein
LLVKIINLTYMTIVVIKRAVRGFIAAALAGIATQLAAGVTVHSLEDLKQLGVSLLTAAIVAGLLALDKMIRYEEPASPIEGEA